MKSMKLNVAVGFALVAALSSTPAVAQKGKGNGNGKHQERTRVEVRDREVRRPATRVERRNTRRVPPGWCKGRGNPHNTVTNCGYHTDRIWRDRNGVWRDRNGDRISRVGIYRDIEGVLRDQLGRVLRF